MSRTRARASGDSGSRKHPHPARGRGAGGAAGAALLDRQGLLRSCCIWRARRSIPARPPFPLLHIDTTWKFRAMIAFRDATVRRFGLELRTHTNPDGLRENINPFDHGGAYTQIMKTDALKQALTDGQLRLRHRRRPARRGTLARQGADLFGPRARPHLGTEAPAAGTLAPVQRPSGAGRDAARLPAVQLDRTRRLDLHPGGRHRRRAAVFRRRAPHRDARRPDHRGGRRPHALQPGEQPADAPGPVPLARLLPAVRRGRLGCRRPGRRSWRRCAPRAISERAGRLIDQDQDASMERKKREGYF